jgi:hypothetical protein
MYTRFELKSPRLHKNEMKKFWFVKSQFRAEGGGSENLAFEVLKLNLFLKRVVVWSENDQKFTFRFELTVRWRC